MMRKILVAICVAGFTVGCGQDSVEIPEIEKAEADQSKADGDTSWICYLLGADPGCDYCDLLGWYEDGVCDDFCDNPDPDCGGECHDASDPSVHYASDSLDECARILYVCEEWQEPFSDACGCGCIDIDDPPQCGGFAGLECEEGYYCDIEGCGMYDQMGVCRPRPDGCREHYEPVCGCDGVTYGNDCHAYMAGVGVASQGECENECPDPNDPAVHYIENSYEDPSICWAIMFECGEHQEPFSDACGCGCIDNGVLATCGGALELNCGDDEYCDYPQEGYCGEGLQVGVCMSRPDGCREHHEPVCGCDSVTYSNDCHAFTAGVDISYRGECGGLCAVVACTPGWDGTPMHCEPSDTDPVGYACVPNA